MNESYRIKNPRKKLRRMLHTELGDVTHKYYGFKEQYLGPSPIKAPENNNKKLPPTYLNYFVRLKNREKMMQSIYYDDSEIDCEKIEEFFRLSLNFTIPFETVPIITIITNQPLEECPEKCTISHAVTLYPEIISFAEYDYEKHLMRLEEKIASNKEFSKVEAMDIIFIMKNVKKHPIKTLTRVCELLNQINVDEDYKNQLKRAMRFVIHIYATNVEEIKKLEKIIFKDDSH